jgi:hypothetical protein
VAAGSVNHPARLVRSGSSAASAARFGSNDMARTTWLAVVVRGGVACGTIERPSGLRNSRRAGLAPTVIE